MAASSNSIAQQFTGLPMADLIGGPLIAASDANGNMAKRQTEFLFNTCFKQKGEGEGANITYDPIMIKLNMTRAVLTFDENTKKPDTSYFTTTLDLPLLTIIPLNNLGVDSVSVNFEMEVTSACSEDIKESSKDNKNVNATLSGQAWWGPFSVSISGTVS